MNSLSIAGDVECVPMAAGSQAERLPADEEEGDFLAAAMAIPRHFRGDLLAHLRALVGGNATTDHGTQTPLAML